MTSASRTKEAGQRVGSTCRWCKSRARARRASFRGHPQPRPVTSPAPRTAQPARPSPSARPPSFCVARAILVSRREGLTRLSVGRTPRRVTVAVLRAWRPLAPATAGPTRLKARGRSCSRPGHAAAPLPRHTFPARAPAPPSAAPRCGNFWPGRGPPKAAPHTVDSQSAEHRRHPPCHQDDVRASKTPRGTLPSMPRSARAGSSLAGSSTQLRWLRRHVPAVTDRIVARLRSALPPRSDAHAAAVPLATPWILKGPRALSLDSAQTTHMSHQRGLDSQSRSVATRVARINRLTLEYNTLVAAAATAGPPHAPSPRYIYCSEPSGTSLTPALERSPRAENKDATHAWPFALRRRACIAACYGKAPRHLGAAWCSR